VALKPVTLRPVSRSLEPQVPTAEVPARCGYSRGSDVLSQSWRACALLQSRIESIFCHRESTVRCGVIEGRAVEPGADRFQVSTST
jgi:hypothetical protein